MGAAAAAAEGAAGATAATALALSFFSSPAGWSFPKKGPGSIPSSAATTRSLSLSGSRCGKVQFLTRRKTHVVLVGGEKVKKEENEENSPVFFCFFWVFSRRSATMRAIL